MDEFHTTSPPTSEIFSDEMDSISISLKKSLHQKTTTSSKGYIPVYDSKSETPIIRGRKTFAFWTLVALLLLLAVGNLILTLTILGVLRLGEGMQSVELVPDEDVIKFYGNIDFDNIYKRDGIIEGFLDEPVDISTEASPILFNLIGRNGRSVNKMKINQSGATFQNINAFDVKNAHSDLIFSTTDPIFNQLKQTRSLNTQQITTNRIASPMDSDLRIEADQIYMKGAEGTKMASREFVWSADQDIYLKSNNGSIVINGLDGVFLDVTKITIAKLKPTGFVTTQFKVCVCMPQGKLFRIPIANVNDRVYCHHFLNTPAQYNPCM